MFGDAKQLEKFIGLRFEYLVYLLNAPMTFVEGICIGDITPSTKACITEIYNSIDAAQKQTMVSFDVVLSAMEWATQWHMHLKSCDSIDGIVASIKDLVSKQIFTQPNANDTAPHGDAQNPGGHTDKKIANQSVATTTSTTSLDLLKNLNSTMKNADGVGNKTPNAVLGEEKPNTDQEHAKEIGSTAGATGESKSNPSGHSAED